MKKIITFEWDNGKGEEYNGKSIVIGQYLPNAQNEEFTHVEVYGISLDISDNSKDLRLKRKSCSRINLNGEIKTISKADARKHFISELDKNLDILYDEGEINMIDETLNNIVYEDVEE